MTDKFMLNGHIIATAFQIEGGKYFARDATKSNYILLQCQGYLSNEQYAILDPLQVIALQYIGIHTYLCRYEPSDLDIIRSLPFVVSATVFHQDIVTNARLKSKSQRRSTTEQQAPHAQSLAAQTDPGNQSSTPTTEGLSDQLLDVNIVLHPLSDRTTGEIKQHIVETLQYSPDAIQTSDHAIRMILKVHDLDAIAGIDEIQTIEEVPELQAHSNFARRDLRIPKVRSTPIEFTGLTQNALDGVGQTVCVADSGFDIGLQGDTPGEVPSRSMFTGIFGSNNRVSIDSQLVPANLRAGPSLDAKTADTSSHGTFVCGNVAADGKASGFGFGRTNIKGTAPGTRLLVQVATNDAGSYSKGVNDFRHLFDQAIALGAQVHNNSYGRLYAPLAGYDVLAQAIDTYTASSANAELVVVFSAGNDQDGLATQGIDSSAMSKNCITVGACESSRQTRYNPAPARPALRYFYDPISPPGSINDIAMFSNRGPDRGLVMPRMKPDLVAPGTCILGPRTKSAAFRGWQVPGTVPPVYSTNMAGVATDTDWMFRHGTSFAAPFISGCAAALRQTLISAGCATPKATLIKALLVNGATDLNGAGQIRAAPIIGPYPDPYQGFGRVNMQASLLNITNTIHGRYHQNDPITQGVVKRWDLYRPPGPFNLRATIVWADRAAPVGGAGPVQSVLVLRAILRPGGAAPPVTRYANTNGPAPDLLNNVQKLVWNNIPTGGVSLEVEARAIVGAAAGQSFAIVWYVD